VQYYQRELCGELEKPDAYLEDPQGFEDKHLACVFDNIFGLEVSWHACVLLRYGI